jgi:hypothetical protein
MRHRLVVLIALGLSAGGIGTCSYRALQLQARERRLTNQIVTLSDRRATRVAVQAEIGAPERRQKSARCAEEWVYRVSSDRYVVLCFDDGGRVRDATLGRSLNRRDY